jgi:arginine repressor
LKELRIVKIFSSDGSMRYVLQENSAGVNVAKIKKISKEDAAKPLFVKH